MKHGLYHVIFVCTGNICRSPMAEGILRTRLSPKTLEFATVSSAGIAAPFGANASEHSITACREKDIDISGHLSRPLSTEMIKNADLILVMEEHHRQAVTRYVPAADGKTFLVSGYPSSGSLSRTPEIEDPIGQDLNVYRDVFRQLDGYVTRLVPHLEASIAEAGRNA